MDAANRLVAARFALVAVVALLISLTAPAPARPAFLAGLYVVPAVVSMALAAVWRERLAPDRLSRWDEAAGFFLLSLVFEAVADPASHAALQAAARHQAGG